MPYLRPIDELPILPKNRESYLTLILELLEWINNFEVRNEKVSYYKYRAWIFDTFGVVESHAKDYQKLATRLGLLTTKVGIFSLTELGARTIHASNDEQLRLLVQQVMRRVVYADLILALFSSINEPLSLEELDAELYSLNRNDMVGRGGILRVLLLRSLGCLQEVREDTFTITEYGTSVAREYYPEAPRPYYAQEIEPRPSMPEHELIARELFQSSRDSIHPERFEHALARAFSFLGFRVQLGGKPGETDVIAYADMGEASYTVIIDAKARKARALNMLEPETLHKHREFHTADYIVVASEGFYTSVIRLAQARDIVLLTLNALADWLRLHEQTPRSMQTYKVFFQGAGLVSSVPKTVLQATAQFERTAKLLSRTIDIMVETSQRGLKTSITKLNVFYMLFSRYPQDEYKQEEFDEVCAFLANPLVGSIKIGENDQVYLVCTRSTLIDILRCFAHHVSKRDGQE